MKNKLNIFSAYMVFLYFAIAITGGIGWVLNIINVCHTFDEPITGLFILRAIGIIVAPLGAVMGYIG